ncbi:MAG: hypothetical protein WAN17_11900 [Candidatus Sulfotelmatobacter sp.]
MKPLFRTLPVLLALTVFLASILFAQISRPSVYIEPQPGLDAFLAASMVRNKVPVGVAAERAGATYVLSVSPIHKTTMGTGWGTDINKAYAYVKLSEKTSNKVLWVFSAGEPTAGHETEKLVAEEIAQHLKKFIKENPEALGGGVQSQKSHRVANFFGGQRTAVYLIPDGYEGHVYIVYGDRDGEPLDEIRGEIIYRIPRSGVLRVREAKPESSAFDQFYYERPDGPLQLIPIYLRSCVDIRGRSAGLIGSEDLIYGPCFYPAASEGDVAASPPQSGTVLTSAGCRVQFKEFHVDAKERLASEYQPETLGRDLGEPTHPAFCPK